jgi:TBC1 domain family protein 5
MVETIVIKADYSTALTLVLRYPSPSAPHLPVTFAEDAQYLHNNLNFEGGRHIITLYSHRQPTLHQPRIQVTKYNRSKGPLSPAIFQAAQIESIVQDVAKNVMDRSEKWGVNRAVREAVVEVRKNVQGYHQQPQQQIGTTNEEILTKRNLELTKALQVQEERNRQMARILDTGIELLSKEYPGEGVEGGFGDGLNRLTHVKECLLDTSKPLDKDLLQPRSHLSSPLPLTSPTTSRRPSHTHSRQSSTSEAFVKTSFKNNSDPDFLTQAQRPRTTLAQSSFAWMLGDDPASKHRSGFVTSKKGVGKKGSISSTVDILSGDSANIVGEGGLLLDLGNNGFDLGNFRKEK